MLSAAEQLGKANPIVREAGMKAKRYVRDKVREYATALSTSRKARYMVRPGETITEAFDRVRAGNRRRYMSGKPRRGYARGRAVNRYRGGYSRRRVPYSRPWQRRYRTRRFRRTYRRYYRRRW